MATAAFAFTTVDASVPKRLLGIEPQPHTARQIHNAGTVTYEGSTAPDLAGRQRHSFVLEFATTNAAGIIANWMWSALHGHVASLDIGGDEVPVQNAAIKRALLLHADDAQTSARLRRSAGA